MKIHTNVRAAVVALPCLFSLGIRAEAFPAPNVNCTESGSRSASWEIRNFTFDTDTNFYYGPGTAGRVSFSIKNSANKYQFNCLQGNGQDIRAPNHFVRDDKLWYSCNTYCHGAEWYYPQEDNPPLETSFNYDAASRILSIQQQWTCASRENSSQADIFTGSGSAVLANIKCTSIPDGRPDQISCAPVDATVGASKVTRGPAPPPSTEGATGYVPQGGGQNNRQPATTKPDVKHDTPGCIKLSKSPSWIMSDFYNAGLGARFTITNQALNYTARCNLNDLSATSEGQLDERNWWNCSRYDSTHATYPYDGIYTEILYGGPQNVLGINQTWYCDDEDSSKPTVYSAYVEAKFAFNCTQTKTCVKSGLEGDDVPLMTINSRCNVGDMTLGPKNLTTRGVSKEQAVADFTPHGYNCSARSLGQHGTPVWQVTGFSFNRTWNPTWDVPGFMDEVQFRYNNTATDSEWPGTRGDHLCYDQSSMGGPPFDGSRHMTCDSDSLFPPGFRFDFNSSTLTLNQIWRCDGIDREHTNYFNAVGGSKLPLECKKVGNGTNCVAEKVQIGMASFNQSLNTIGSPYEGLSPIGQA